MPLPYNIMISGNFQIYDAPGAGLTVVPPYFAANYVVNAAVAGRPITGGQTTIDIDQRQSPGAEPDLSASTSRLRTCGSRRPCTVGRLRTTALAEFENLFNIRSINAVTQNYGANWLRPVSVQRGLNVRFGLQMRY